MSFYIFYTWKTATRTQREARGDVRAGCLNRCHLLLTAPLCHCDHFHFHSAIRVRCLSWSFNVSKCAFLKVQIFTQMFSAYSSNTVYESFQISKKNVDLWYSAWDFLFMTHFKNDIRLPEAECTAGSPGQPTFDLVVYKPQMHHIYFSWSREYSCHVDARQTMRNERQFTYNTTEFDLTFDSCYYYKYHLTVFHSYCTLSLRGACCCFLPLPSLRMKTTHC